MLVTWSNLYCNISCMFYPLIPRITRSDLSFLVKPPLGCLLTFMYAKTPL
jgi:hypothetical protein